MPLRRITKEDLFTILEWRNAPEVRRNMFSTHEIAEDEHLAWFERVKNSQDCFWYIYTSDNGNIRGVVCFTNYDLKTNTAFWGFYTGLGTPKGTGTKMCVCGLDKAFLSLRFEKVYGAVLHHNEKSIYLHKKLGFRHLEVLPIINKKIQHDAVYFEISRSEWMKKRIEFGFNYLPPISN